MAEQIKGLGLLSAKPIIYAANVLDSDLASGNAMVDKVREFASAEGCAHTSSVSVAPPARGLQARASSAHDGSRARCGTGQRR